MASDDQSGLAALLDQAPEGDVVVVVALDRLGRSLFGIIDTIETLTAAGVPLRSLRESIDTATPVGRFQAGVFASLEYERPLINERSAATREAARASGQPVDHPAALTPDQTQNIPLRSERASW